MHSEVDCHFVCLWLMQIFYCWGSRAKTLSFLLFMCLFPSQFQGGLFKPFVVTRVTNAPPPRMAAFHILHGNVWWRAVVKSNAPNLPVFLIVSPCWSSLKSLCPELMRISYNITLQTNPVQFNFLGWCQRSGLHCPAQLSPATYGYEQLDAASTIKKLNLSFI